MCHVLGTLYAQLDFVESIYMGASLLVAYWWNDFSKPLSKLFIYLIFKKWIFYQDDLF